MRIFKQTLIAFLGTLVLFSCNDDDITTNDNITLSEVVNTLGGESVINSVATMSYTANGEDWEHEEEEPNVANPINTSNYVRNVSTELNERKLRYDFSSINYLFPFNYDVGASTKIINDQLGTYSGDAAFAAHFFGVTNANPVLSSGIESALKIQKMSNPLELLKDVMANNDLSTTTSSSFIVASGITGLNIDFVIDGTTNLPASARITEVDFLNGDVIFEVSYADWTAVGQTMYPSTLSYSYNNDLVRTEELTNIEINPTLESDAFTPEISSTVYDNEQGDFGIYSSWWYERFVSLGGPIDQPLNNGAEEITISGQVVGPNLKLIGRADVGYWSVAIKTSTGIVVVEPSLNQRWTRSVIDAVKNEAFPGESIEAVIATHTHFDHLGGIRELAQESGKVYIGQAGVAYTEGVLNSNSTLLPDALTTNPTNVAVEGVSDVTILDGGAIEIHLLNSSSLGLNPHSEDIVAVYVPEYEAFIVADLFNSGGFIFIAQGLTANSFNSTTKAIIAERSGYLLDYIEEKNLTVSRVIAIHNGVGSMADLEILAGL